MNSLIGNHLAASAPAPATSGVEQIAASMPSLPPALLLIFGALFVPFLPLAVRRIFVVALPLLALAYVITLPNGEGAQITLFEGFGEMTGLRVDKLSRAFGIIFTINAAIAFLYAFYVKRSDQHVAALMYIGGALGVVFAGDLISLYIYWEVMAVASTLVILARQTERAKGAAYRYLLIHVIGGLLLLAGIAITIGQTGSIAFSHYDWDLRNAGTWLMVLGVLVNAGAPPLSAWLSDSYPEASVTGGLILSAYTTKTSIYVLLRGFAGWDFLIWVGCIMALYGIIMAVLENDIRRMLAYTIINQVGFMVCAAGVGTSMAVDGAVAHAFCHIIYKSLLWMCAGAILFRVGTSKFSELGGLYKSMPLTLFFTIMGGLAIFFSGFTSKGIIVSEIHHHPELFWPWLILEIASVGVLLHAAVAFPYLIFFNKDQGHRPKEAPKTMLLAMGALTLLTLLITVAPGMLHSLLPHGAIDHHTDEPYKAYKWSKFVTSAQMLLFSILAFLVFLKFQKKTSTISLDTDWLYRKGTPFLTLGLDKSLNGINAATHKSVIGGIIPKISSLFSAAPAKLLTLLATPVWMAQGVKGEELSIQKQELAASLENKSFPVGISVFAAVIGIGLFILF